MRDQFPEYFPLNPEEILSLWTEGFVIFDTNVLLRMYRYSETTVKEIVSVLDDLGDRLWSPYQVAWEYNKRRLTKIKESEKSYGDLIGEFERCCSGAKLKIEALKGYGIHPKIELENSIVSLIDDIEKRIESIKNEYNSKSTSAHYAEVHEIIAGLYKDKIGKEPGDDRLKELISEAEERYKLKIPPGTRDVEAKRKINATDREVFGDFLIWNEIIEHAKLHDKPVIFVTEDAKDDWWLREENKTIGPLPALRKEFIANVARQVHFYRIQSFMEQSKLSLKTSISQESVQDIITNNESSYVDINDKGIVELDMDRNLDRRKVYGNLEKYIKRAVRARLDTSDLPTSDRDKILYLDYRYEKLLERRRNMRIRYESDLERVELFRSETEESPDDDVRHALSYAYEQLDRTRKDLEFVESEIVNVEHEINRARLMSVYKEP